MLDRLASYYLDCLSHDDLGGVSAYASSRYGALDYVELTKLPGADGSPEQLEDTPELRQLRSRVQGDRNTKALVVGYPVRLNPIRSKSSGQPVYKVEPLFLFALNEASSGSPVPSLANDPPQINFEALRALAGVNDYLLLDEAIRLAEEFNLSGVGGTRPDPMSLLDKLRSIRPDWDWKEALEPAALSTGPRLPVLSTPGIHNRAVVAIVDRPPYTKGLESDLAALKKASADGSALGAWLQARRQHNAPTPRLSLSRCCR